MIKFTAELVIKKIEEKSIRKRDGDMFNFTEVTLEQGGKYPTLLVARADETVVSFLQEGMKASFDLGITSFTTQDGRTFNNFLIKDVAIKHADKQPASTSNVGMGDELPF